MLPRSKYEFVLLAVLSACSSGSNGPDAAPADVAADTRATTDAPAAHADAVADSQAAPDLPTANADAAADSQATTDGPTAHGDTAADSQTAPVLLEANTGALPGQAMVGRGTATFRLKPFDRDVALAGVRFLIDGDQPPGDFGGGGVDVELSRGRPGAGAVRLAREWIGACDRQGPRPCWTGPDFNPPVMIRSGERDIWISIARLGGEGGSFRLPVTAAPTNTTFESWSTGQVNWSSTAPTPPVNGWTRAPMDLPWVFRLLGR